MTIERKYQIYVKQGRCNLDYLSSAVTKHSTARLVQILNGKMAKRQRARERLGQDRQPETRDCSS